jgi:hypothetical protein
VDTWGFVQASDTYLSPRLYESKGRYLGKSIVDLRDAAVHELLQIVPFAGDKKVP